jgi:hypothetical protein
VAQWNTAKVGEWLDKMKLGHHTAAFKEARITGDVLQFLREEHLKEMGVTVIGERVAMLGAVSSLTPALMFRLRYVVILSGVVLQIAKLARKALVAKRFRVLWETYAQRYQDGPCQWCLMQVTAIADGMQPTPP